MDLDDTSAGHDRRERQSYLAGIYAAGSITTIECMDLRSLSKRVVKRLEDTEEM